jgi:hypothetical protein
MVTSRESHNQEAIFVSMLKCDNGAWLHSALACAREKTQSQPDSTAVARMREAVLSQIECESIPLVA